MYICVLWRISWLSATQMLIIQIQPHSLTLTLTLTLECGCICMISICVADNQLWLLWLNDGYHYESRSAVMTIWSISVWLSSVLPHISVWLLTNSVNVWPYQCMSGNQSMYYIQSIFYFFISFITQIILIVFFSGQINPLYDV